MATKSKVKAKKKSKGPQPYTQGRPCPKCGPGTNLGAHSNRLACGKCGYTEMTSAEKK